MGGGIRLLNTPIGGGKTESPHNEIIVVVVGVVVVVVLYGCWEYLVWCNILLQVMGIISTPGTPIYGKPCFRHVEGLSLTYAQRANYLKKKT